jgi:hypothetical protein
MLVTLGEIKTRIRQRTDNEHSGEDFVTDDELTQLIRKSYFELFALLVKAGLHSVPEAPVLNITADGRLNYLLPDDFYSVIDVYRINNGTKIRLRRHNARTRPDNINVGEANTYRVYGQSEDARLEFYPNPQSGEYEFYYIAIPEPLVDDADELDGVLGWEEYIVADVSVDVLTKEGVDTKYLQFKKAEMTLRIQEESSMRDMHESTHVASVRRYGGENGSLVDEYGYLPGGHRGVRGYWGGV